MPTRERDIYYYIIMVNHTTLRHVLVIRLSGLSPTATTVHALRGLRRDFPELRITVLTIREFEPLFGVVDGVDFLFADEPVYSGFFGGLKLWRKIQQLDVDAMADLESTPRTRRLTFSLKRRRVARIDKSRSESRLMTRKFRKVISQLEPLSQRSREVFNKLGLPFCMPAPIRRKRRNEPPQIATILAGEKVGRWIGVSLLAPHRGRCYPIPLANSLIAELSARYERVFLFGDGKYERQFCEGMQQLYDSVVSIAGRASLTEKMELISYLDAVVTIDDAVLSLASLVGTPAVSIWGATHPFIDSCGYGQDPANSVQIDLPCRPCSVNGARQCIFGNYECMNKITPEMVLNRVEALLGV